MMMMLRMISLRRMMMKRMIIDDNVHVAEDEVDDGGVEHDELRGRKGMVLGRRRIMMLRLMMLRKKRNPKTGPRLCASLCSRNALGHVTRAT